MKKSFILCLGAMLILAFGMSSCSSSDENKVNKQANEFLSFAVSGCKNNVEQTNIGNSNRALVFDAIESIRYEGTKDGSLMIFHENAIFSCEAKIEKEVTINENTICIVEKDVSQTTNCLCCYDLSMKVGPLENKSYRIVVCKNSEMGKYIDFTIDYSPTTKGDIKVER